MIATVRRIMRLAQPLVPGSRSGVVVLCYHLVEAGTGSPVDLGEAVFRSQVAELAGSADVIRLDDLQQSLGGGIFPQKPKVVVTFDDAYRNFFDQAWPILAKRGVAATMFVPVGFITGRSRPPMTGTLDLAPASWGQLREAVDGGLLSVGSHSWTHADTRTLDRMAARRELGDSRRELEDRLGVEVSSFCYPRGLWNARAERLVGEYYDLAVVGGGRRVTAASFQPLRIPRIPLRRGGPKRLAPMLRCRVWLEEWIADRVRRMRG